MLDKIANPTELTGIGQLINNIIITLSNLASVVAMIYLMLGGLKYIMSGGDKKKADNAKAAIKNAVIGLIIVLVSYLVVEMVLTQVVGAKLEFVWDKY